MIPADITGTWLALTMRMAALKHMIPASIKLCQHMQRGAPFHSQARSTTDAHALPCRC